MSDLIKSFLELQQNASSGNLFDVSKKKAINEAGMPASIIKHKQKLAGMSNSELADHLKGKSEDDLKKMAWSHGYGKMSDHYVARVKKGSVSEEAEVVDEAVSRFLSGPAKRAAQSAANSRSTGKAASSAEYAKDPETGENRKVASWRVETKGGDYKVSRPSKEAAEEHRKQLDFGKDENHPSSNHTVKAVFAKEETISEAKPAVDMEAMMAAFKAKGGDVKKVETGLKSNIDQKEVRKAMFGTGEKAKAKGVEKLSADELNPSATFKHTNAGTRRRLRKEEQESETMDETLFSEEELAHIENVLGEEEVKKRGRGRPKKESAPTNQDTSVIRRVAAQIRDVRPRFNDSGKEVVKLQHPDTGKYHDVPVQHVHVLHKAYAMAPRPADKDKVEKAFIDKHMS